MYMLAMIPMLTASPSLTFRAAIRQRTVGTNFPPKFRKPSRSIAKARTWTSLRPTALEVLAAQPEYQDGVWLLVDVDVSQLTTRPVRLNVSLPEGLVKRIDAYAKAHHLSRSGFLEKAAVAEMERQ